MDFTYEMLQALPLMVIIKIYFGKSQENLKTLF